MYTRIISESLPPEGSAFLFGPRQTGKTTILKSLKSLLYINLLNTDELLLYNKRPSNLYKKIAALKEKIGMIIIDEIQKAPALLDEVQRVIDEYSELHFILSGSSARKLKRGSANLLGGRAEDLKIYPLTLGEIDGNIDISTLIKFGSLPRIVSLISTNKRSFALKLLNSYVSSYLNEEIKAESLVRKLDNFQRFLEVAGHQFAREINMSSLANQALLSDDSVKNYYSILEDTLIGFFLHPYSTSIRKELTKTAKFYFFDNGVTRAIQGTLSGEPSFQEIGYLFEQWVVQEVVRLNNYLSKGLKINFWQTRSRAEVDIVISKGNELVLAIECKSTQHPREKDLSGLLSFKDEYPKVKRVLCAMVDSSIMLGDVQVITPYMLEEIIREI